LKIPAEAGSGCLATQPTSAASYHPSVAAMVIAPIQVSISAGFQNRLIKTFQIVVDIPLKNADTVR
jgi:hypothetical protein